MNFQFKNNFSKIILINSLLLLIIFFVLEVSAKLINSWAIKEFEIDHWKFNIDPAVGHSHDSKDFEILDIPNSFEKKASKLHTKINKPKKDKKTFKISVFGGSTTDPLGTQFSGNNGTWPYLLHNIINRNSSNLNV